MECSQTGGMGNDTPKQQASVAEYLINEFKEVARILLEKASPQVGGTLSWDVLRDVRPCSGACQLGTAYWAHAEQTSVRR